MTVFRKKRRHFPLTAALALLLLGAWLRSESAKGFLGVEGSTKVPTRSSIVVAKATLKRPLSKPDEVPLRFENVLVPKARSTRRLSKVAKDYDLAGGRLDVSSAWPGGTQKHLSVGDRRGREKARKNTKSENSVFPRVLTLGSEGSVRVQGGRFMADFKISLSRLRPGDRSNRIVSVSGELLLEMNSRGNRVYLEPSEIDGKPPSQFVRQLVRGINLYDVVGHHPRLDRFLVYWTERFETGGPRVSAW